MQCDQIRTYLADYRTGNLPSYKSAWVAQHLAGCAECQTQLHQAPESAGPAEPSAEAVPTAAAVDPALFKRGEVSVAIQRPVPAWLQVAIILVLVGLAGVSAWLIAARPHLQPERHVNIWSLGVRARL